MRDLLAPAVGSKQRHDRRCGRRVERLALADQEVVFDDERDEVDALARRSRLDAEARVGRAGRDCRRDGEVVRFLVVEAANRRRVDPVTREEFLEQRAGSGGGRAVHESQPRQVVDAAHAERIALRHEQALRAVRDADQFLAAEPQQRAERAMHLRAALREFGARQRKVDARECAVALPELPERLEAALVAQVEQQFAFGLAQALEQRQRQVVAGHAVGDLHRVVERDRQLAADLGGQVLDLRRQPRPDPRLGPQQLLGELGQACRAPLVPVDQRAVEPPLLLLQVAPQVTVRPAELARRRRDRTFVPDRAEHVEEGIAQVPPAGSGQRVLQFDGNDAG